MQWTFTYVQTTTYGYGYCQEEENSYMFSSMITWLLKQMADKNVLSLVFIGFVASFYRQK